MDHMRYTEIIEELSDYDPSVKAARVGSTVTIGEIVEMAKAADTIERIQSECTFWHEKWRRDWRALNEARAEVERLKAEAPPDHRFQLQCPICKTVTYHEDLGPWVFIFGVIVGTLAKTAGQGSQDVGEFVAE